MCYEQTRLSRIVIRGHQVSKQRARLYDSTCVHDRVQVGCAAHLTECNECACALNYHNDSLLGNAFFSFLIKRRGV